MSGSLQVQLAKLEKMSVEEIELINLLNSYGMSERVIEAFLVNCYTIKTLKIIQRKEIEELLPSPFLADRTRFIHELDSWREAQGLAKVSEQPVTCNSFVTRDNNARPSEETQVTREACTPTFLLNASSKGQAILRKYSKTAFLSRADKKTVTHIVVDEFKTRFSKLSSSKLLDRACELKQLCNTHQAAQQIILRGIIERIELEILIKTIISNLPMISVHNYVH
ncbi:uncharacterized protein LOC135713766 [Ochlerotatus camptorhynchus]|uniref:uncharacterized protein LOC135713766 n=1 Tax=Ochlerotatus camptorhynchus TaxID=644619 RepID=UPI0031D47F12